jgi:NUMOD3 motif
MEAILMDKIKEKRTGNYKSNSGSFKKGLVPWNKDLKKGKWMPCLVCGRLKYFRLGNMRNENQGKYCSPQHRGLALRGKITWNIGRKHSEETKKKMSNAAMGHKPAKALSGEDNPGWRGIDVSYSGLHHWVKKHLGRPSKCEHCGTTTAKKFEWANRSGLYLREVEDWIRLCTSCHRQYDYTYNITKGDIFDEKGHRIY